MVHHVRTRRLSVPCRTRSTPSSTRRFRSPSLWCQEALVLDDALRDLDESEVALARGDLEPPERFLLGNVERGHQQALGALDELAIFERLLRLLDFRLERLELGL